MAKKKSVHGGKRENAGRKKSDNPKTSRYLSAHQSQWEAWNNAAEKAGLNRNTWLALIADAMSKADIKELSWRAQQDGKTLAEYVQERLE